MTDILNFIRCITEDKKARNIIPSYAGEYEIIKLSGYSGEEVYKELEELIEARLIIESKGLNQKFYSEVSNGRLDQTK
ncbi:MAG: hypothetical protein RR293_07770 [Bacteroidales bacterium]